MLGRERESMKGRRHSDGDKTTTVDPETTAGVHSWLGPYPVLRAPPAFENLTFRKLRGSRSAGRLPSIGIETQKDRDQRIRFQREVRKRIQRSLKSEEKKLRRQLLRKRRREQHEHNTLRRRACGLPSHRTVQRLVGQKKDADNIWSWGEKMSRASKESIQAAKFAIGTEKNTCHKSDEDNEEEDSDSEDWDDSGSYDDQQDAEEKYFDGMEYDDESGELIEKPRKWGRWFKMVRKDDEGDEFSENF